MTNTKMKISMMIEEDIWREFQVVAKKFGLSASYLSQLIMASVIEGQKRGINEITKNMMIGMVKGAKDVSKKNKNEIIEVLSQDD